MGAIRELLRPPGHRGPLIAAGAVPLTLGVALEQLRLDPGEGVQFAIAAASAALLLWLALQARLEGGRPPAYQSVLLVCGLLLHYAALLRLADVLGADFGADFPAGAFAWTGVVQAGVAAFASARRNSAIAALVAAAAAGAALLSGWQWLFEPGSSTAFRWLLLLLAIVFALTSLPLRGISLRHAEQMVNAAGLAILGIGISGLLPLTLFGFGSDQLPGLWELVVLAGGLGLVAYAAADRAPGPAYLGALVLAVFVIATAFSAEETLRWWPLVLLVTGGAMIAAGLRPRAPLPPEPDAGAYRPQELPLSARSEADVTVRVHREE